MIIPLGIFTEVRACLASGCSIRGWSHDRIITRKQWYKEILTEEDGVRWVGSCAECVLSMVRVIVPPEETIQAIESIIVANSEQNDV